MHPDNSALGERIFLSVDLARMAGVSRRQLQWWDERKLISPCIEDHRRVYVPEQVLEILTVAALRRKGLSLQKIRKVLRLLRRELGKRGDPVLASPSGVYLLTDGNAAMVDDQPDNILGRLADASKRSGSRPRKLLAGTEPSNYSSSNRRTGWRRTLTTDRRFSRSERNFSSDDKLACGYREFRTPRIRGRPID